MHHFISKQSLVAAARSESVTLHVCTRLILAQPLGNNFIVDSVLVIVTLILLPDPMPKKP